MHIVTRAVAIALLLGSAQAASAGHKTIGFAHRAASPSADNYLALSPRQEQPRNDDRGFSYGPFQPVPDGTTGGPVGGTGS